MTPEATPEHSRLTTALRELRTRTGLSLAALAERTPYSKSSWERYLNGRTLPPRRAVQDLCRLAGEPEGRMLALWEIAESQWSGRAAEAPSTPQPSSGPPRKPAQERPDRPDRADRKRLMTVLTSVCAVTLGGVTAVVVMLSDRQGASDPPPTAPSAPGPRCRGASCEGQDPIHMFCGAGPDTLTTERTSTGARVELRYSPRCEASWARMWRTRTGDRLEIAASGPTHRAEVEGQVDTESYVYTVMTAARPGTVVRACFRPAAADAGRECVDARVGRETTDPPAEQRSTAGGAAPTATPRPASAAPRRSRPASG
ncbi:MULTISPECIES: XRE family transcriptional regulator [Streptomyces]|uniref:helix-turn-helix domain-containing protein n=1 Tax=Streptomyces TaxID=1883 RepID=UPI00240DA7BA|nr:MULTISPECIES: XRE family transcriptional regulator [Streptomyces]WFB88112.1 XRE family transcriptional regulator [Streptomyces olivaceus]WGK47715.1 XRE family transcriptional regulator [Streptomyces sp. B146]